MSAGVSTNLAVILSGDSSGLGKMLDGAKSGLSGFANSFTKTLNKATGATNFGYEVGSRGLGGAVGAALGRNGGDLRGALGDAGGLSGLLKGIGKATEGTDGALGGLNHIASVLGTVGGVAGAAFTGITSAVGGFTAIASATNQFVGKANPMAVERFGHATDDFQGVIGRSLVPATNFFTKVTRVAADSLDSLLNGKPYTPGSSLNAALRPAEYTSPEDISRSSILQAAQMAQADEAGQGDGQSFGKSYLRAAMSALEFAANPISGAGNVGATLGRRVANQMGYP